MKRERGAYFYRLFIQITFLTALVVLALSIVLYAGFKSSTLAAVNRANETLLRQAIHNAEQVHAYIQTYAVSLTNNPDVQKLMQDDATVMLETLNRMRALDMLLKGTPYLESLYVYNGYSDLYYIIGPNPLIRSGGSFDKEADALVREGAPASRLTPIPRKIPRGELSPAGEADVYTYTLAGYDRDGAIVHALVLNVRADSLLTDLTADGIDTLDTSRLWFMGGDGDVYGHTDGSQFLRRLADESYVRRIAAAGDDSGYFTDVVDGAEAVVHYARSGKLGWLLVCVTPYDTVAAAADRVKYVTAGLGALVLASGIPVVYMLSGRLYAPVRRLRNRFGGEGEAEPAGATADPRQADEFALISDAYSHTRHNLRELEKFRRDHLSALKDKALADLVQSGLPTGSDPERWRAEYGIALKADEPIALVLLKLDGYAAVCRQYDDRDRGLLRYALANMAVELTETAYTCEAVGLGEDRVVLLLGGSGLPEAVGQTAGRRREELRQLLGRIRQQAQQVLKLSVSAFVSAAGRSLGDAPGLYREAAELSCDRLLAGHGCILFVRERRQPPDEPPPDADSLPGSALIEGIQEGRLSKMLDGYGQLADKWASCSYNQVTFGMSCLTWAIFNQLHRMERNGTIRFGLQFAEVDSRLRDAETLEEVHAEFRSLFEHIVQRVEDNRDRKSERFVEQALRYIADNYADPALSTQSISGLLQITPAYLNKLCKDGTARSISDWITQTRLEQAQSLLRQSQLTVDQILAAIGWENKKYFFRVFKRQTGVTPMDYRLKCNLEKVQKP